MRVLLTHTTRLQYSSEVVEGVMDVRVGPFSDAHQRWEHFDLRVAPHAAIRSYTDGFGNAAHLITNARPHRSVELVSTGDVQTLLRDPFAQPDRPPRPLGPAELADYLAPSPLVPTHPSLQALAAEFKPEQSADAFEAARGLMERVYLDFTYRKDVTTVATTVGEVLASRVGVCQDFAHVLIGLYRVVGIPARYVSGYIVQGSDARLQRRASDAQREDQPARQGQAPDRGAGASHAWVEAFTVTHGWRGFDPTNNLVASEYHVKMAIGRDYGDVPPTRGTFRGVADEQLSVNVTTRVVE